MATRYPRGDIVKSMAVTPESEELPSVRMDEELEVFLEGEEGELNEMVEGGEIDESHFANLAAIITDTQTDGEKTLTQLAGELIDFYPADKESRKDWAAIAGEAVDLLGFTIEDRDNPFPGAAGASHPLLAQSVIKFQAKAYRELFPTGGPVRTRILGVQTPEREAQASRVREFMNYQITMQMPEYGPELDRLLFYTALYGSGFKKTYFDAALGRSTSRFVKADDFIIDYYATDLQTAERYTHVLSLTDNEVKRNELAGLFRALELPDGDDPEITEAEETTDTLHGRKTPSRTENRRTLLEMHVNLDLPGYEQDDGLHLPYVVTVDETSKKILAIRRNWKEEDQLYQKITWFTHYNFIPGLGFYGYGYLHLVGGLAKTATSTLRQLLDAGTFANLPAGFKSHGLRVLAPDQPLAPGEWREVNAPAQDLAKALVPAPYKEPSPTLMKLLDTVVATARDFADSTDAVVADSSNYGPVGTTLALLEQSAKLYSAIHTRMHMAQAQDLRLLADLNSQYLPDQYPFETEGGETAILREDFNLASVDVIPVSDPNMPTEAHRVAKLNSILQIAQAAPQLHNQKAIMLDLYRGMGVESPERYMAESQQPFTGDPLSENQAAIIGQPLTVAPHQNDDAHITVHAAMLGNPAYAENPQFKMIMMAHVNEHLASKYKKEILALVGDEQVSQAVEQAQQPPGPQGPAQPLPPEVENAIATKVADVSDALLKFDEMKAKALQGDTNDPAIEFQRTEQRLREKKMDDDKDTDDAKLKLQREKIIIDDANKDEDRALKERELNKGD